MASQLLTGELLGPSNAGKDMPWVSISTWIYIFKTGRFTYWNDADIRYIPRYSTYLHITFSKMQWCITSHSIPKKRIDFLIPSVGSLCFERRWWKTNGLYVYPIYRQTHYWVQSSMFGQTHVHYTLSAICFQYYIYNMHINIHITYPHIIYIHINMYILYIIYIYYK